MASQETTNEESVMKEIAEPRETDVLCGRGGAALRHAGNQTYRRLVNLNKGLYITCMKTEKLKISRSIVAAIREQKGRFLERDAKKEIWFDIGDKKAVEKTSQALREGQPKLRKKMVEMGQMPPEQANDGIDPQQQLLQQYGNGIYNTRAPQSNASNSLNGSMSGSMNGSMNMLMNNGMSMSSLGRIGSIGSGSIGRLESIGSGGNMGRMESMGSGNMGRMGSMGSGNMGRLESLGSGGNMGRLESIGSGGSMGSRTSYMLDSIQQEQQQKQMMMGRNNTGRMRTNMSQMPPPPTRTFSNGTNNMNSMGGNDLTILQHLSLNSTPQSIPSWTPSMGSMESLMTMSTTDVPQMISRRNLSRQYNRNPSYGSHNNNNSNMRDMNNMRSISSNTSNNNDGSGFATMNGNGHGTDRTSIVEPTKFLSEKIGSFDPTEQPYRQQQQQQQQQQQLPRTREQSPNRFNESNNNNNNNNNNNTNDQRSTGPSINERRRIFARMKRPKSPRMLTSQRSITDSMPDIHMVDSQFSLLSNLSAHGSKHSKHRGNALDMDISKHGLTKKDSIGSEYIGVGSRRSLMSGLSKLSGHSTDINNTFSNMSKKFTGTNHTISSRSLTMSEFSGVDEDDDFAEDDFSFDIPTQRNH